jgi:hypothetical protein
MREDTWTCHICREERPDRFISVVQHHRVGKRGVEFTENVRYCNDRPECIHAAQTFHFIPEDAELR